MEYREFLNRVAVQPGVGGEDEALAATKATLGTLGERLQGALIDDTAEQLDQGLATMLHAFSHTEDAEVEFGLRGFYERVAERAGVTPEKAVAYARAAMATLQEALTPEMWESLRADLPGAYGELMGGYPPGPGGEARTSTYDVPS